MKIFKYKYNLLFLIASFGFLLNSCTDDDAFVLSDGTKGNFSDFGVTFENSGALMAISDVVTGFYDLADLANASIGFTVSNSAGESVTGADALISFKGKTVVLNSLSSFPATLTVPLSEALTALGLSTSDLGVGDNFTFSLANVKTGTGTYRSGTSLDVPVTCSSDLAGTYSSITVGKSTDGCCPNETTVSKDLVIASTGGTSYTISDFSGGLYLEWYAIYGITSTTNLSAEFADVCGNLSGSFTEPFGSAASVVGTVDQATGVITMNWVNGYDDAGTIIMTPK